MSGSYRKINYRLRPAKSAERKMMCDVFRRLAPFGRVDTYKYIGFGSLFFNDFILFHRSLGISDMISIEARIDEETRFRMNLPFKFVDLRMGWSNEILPKLDWGSKAIIWLDYDGPLTQKVLNDVKTVVSNIQPGSFLAITVNAHAPENEDDEDAESVAPSHNGSDGKLSSLKRELGEKLPPEISSKDIAGWRCAALYRRIVLNEIETILGARNGGRRPGQRMSFKQILHIQYQDNAKMLTVGGLLIDESQGPIFGMAGFDCLPFFRPSDESFRINVPSLTFKEMRQLDSAIHYPELTMPHVNGDEIGIPQREVAEYLKIYRYFPLFSEVEF